MFNKITLSQKRDADCINREIQLNCGHTTQECLGKGMLSHSGEQAAGLCVQCVLGNVQCAVQSR
jgi:hypothetical protein